MEDILGMSLVSINGCRMEFGATFPSQCPSTTLAWRCTPTAAHLPLVLKRDTGHVPRFSRTTISGSFAFKFGMGFPLPSTAGIETVGAAALFAVLYAALVPLYLWKTARNPTYTFIVLIIFCICESPLFATDDQGWLRVTTVRITGFILRAILAASDGAKENAGIVIAEMIFFTLGFVGLLYSAFILILGRLVFPLVFQRRKEADSSYVGPLRFE